MQQELFYNTINLSGAPLAEATNKASRQNDRILEIMKDGKKRTPFDVWKAYNKIYPEVPITSIRRAMSVLTDQGKLEMLDEMKKEKYGSPNHYWKVK